MTDQQILARYFTPEQIPRIAIDGDFAVIGDARFTIDRPHGSIVWSSAPSDEWLTPQLQSLPTDEGTWTLVAFLKVRCFDDPTGVISRARTGVLYDEDYYTRRGGGSPYVGYPRQANGHDTTAHFAALASEVQARFGAVEVLDAGCATGVLVAAFQRTGCRSCGIDVSHWAVEHSIARNVVQGTLLQLPWPDDKFDLVISQDVLEHIHADDLPRALAEQARVTRAGGHLVHFVPFYPEYTEPVQIDAHLTNADRAWWERFFDTRPGLRVVQTPGEGDQWTYSQGILSRYFVMQVQAAGKGDATESLGVRS
jgi:SAM-dependent methyltransferase